MNAIKRAATIFGIVFICLVLFAGCPVVVELGHDCIGENCAVCSNINLVQEILHALTLLATATILVFVLYFAFKSISFFVKKHLFFTLISLKVKLSD